MKTNLDWGSVLILEEVYVWAFVLFVLTAEGKKQFLVVSRPEEAVMHGDENTPLNITAC